MAFRCINAFNISESLIRKALLKPSFAKHYVIITKFCLQKTFRYFSETDK